MLYDRILAAIDATPNEDAVLSQTQELARLVGATVYVVHATAPRALPAELFESTRLAAAPDYIDASERELVVAAVARLAAAGVEAKGELLDVAGSEVGDAIVERAKELDVQLIVLGETLHRRVARTFRGSVADQVIHRHPPASVLLVH